MVKPSLFVRARWEAEIAGQAVGMSAEALFQQDFWILLVSKVSDKMIWISYPKSEIDPFSSFACPPWRGITPLSLNYDLVPALLKYHTLFNLGLRRTSLPWAITWHAFSMLLITSYQPYNNRKPQNEQPTTNNEQRISSPNFKFSIPPTFFICISKVSRSHSLFHGT